MPSSGNGSVSCRICETIREKILTGEFKPGQRMVEAKVAKSFGVSITPVREAFSTLVKQGLLTTFPYCGTYVTILTYEYARPWKLLPPNWLLSTWSRKTRIICPTSAVSQMKKISPGTTWPVSSMISSSTNSFFRRQTILCCVRFGISPKAVSPFSSRSPAPTARPLPPS